MCDNGNRPKDIPNDARSANMIATTNLDPAILKQLGLEMAEIAEMEERIFAPLEGVNFDEDDEDEGPSADETWQQMANDGDMIGLCNVWANALPGMLDLRHFASYLQQAVMIRARK